MCPPWRLEQYRERRTDGEFSLIDLRTLPAVVLDTYNGLAEEIL